MHLAASRSKTENRGTVVKSTGRYFLRQEDFLGLMTCLSAKIFASGDNSKHGRGILVGKITATSLGEENTISADRQRVSEDR